MRNPVFTKARALAGSETMSIERTVTKTFIMALAAIAAAAWSWNSINAAGESGSGIMLGATLAAFVVGLIITFVPTTAPLLAIPYALLEGAALGAISLQYERQSHGLAIHAVLITFGLLLAMLALYRTGAVKVGDKFRSGVSMAMVGILIYYLGTMLLSLFGVAIPSLLSQGPFAIGISLVFIVVACAMLLIDFDNIVIAARSGAPASCEWYLAFGLVLTVVWMYLEVMRFLKLTGGSDD